MRYITFRRLEAVSFGHSAVYLGLLLCAFVLYPTPLYPHYADLFHRPGGISAIEDQQIAGGMMWVFGSISYTVTAIYAFWRWVEPDKLASGRGASVAT